MRACVRAFVRLCVRAYSCVFVRGCAFVRACVCVLARQRASLCACVRVRKTRWADVGGLDAVKLRLQQLVQWPLQAPQLCAALGLGGCGSARDPSPQLRGSGCIGYFGDFDNAGYSGCTTYVLKYPCCLHGYLLGYV
eukprot:5911741-Pleurochrysis_carterae.AAC.4